jgi:hypothetical protein
MSQCVVITKTGVRCSRIVKDGGNLCFQHKQSQPPPKAKFSTRRSGKKKDGWNKGDKIDRMALGAKFLADLDKSLALEKLAKSQPQAQPQAHDLEEHERCKWFRCVNPEPNGFTIVSFPKDHFLFRSATEEGQKFKMPSWYSDEDGARVYGGGRNVVCIRYITKRKLLLIDMSNPANFHSMLGSPLLTDAEKYVVSYVSGINATQEIKARRRVLNFTNNPCLLVFSPFGFLTAEDRQKGDHVNLLFARIVCKFGYDGWFIPRHAIINGTGGDYFTQEVLLCNPEEVLTRTQERCAR